MKIFHLKGGDIMTSPTQGTTIKFTYAEEFPSLLNDNETTNSKKPRKRTRKKKNPPNRWSIKANEHNDLAFVNKTLIDRLKESDERNVKSIEAGNKIIELVKPIFEILEKDDKLPPNYDISMVLNELNKKEDLLKQLEIPTNSKKTEKTTKSTQGSRIVHDSSKLAESLETLLKEINDTIAKQFQPGESPDLKELETQCNLFTERLKQSRKNSTDLTKDVENKLEHLRHQIKDRESNVIPEEHCKSIARYQNISIEQVKEGLEAREKVRNDIKARHDELAAVWEKVQIRVQAIESKIQHIDVYTNLIALLKQLKKELAGLYEDIESQKEQLKKDKSETYINKCKKEAKGFKKRYEDLSKRGLELKNSTEEILKIVSDQIEKENPEKTIPERKGNLKIYDKTIKENVEKEISKTLKSVDEEKRELKQELSAEWNSIFTLIDKTLSWDGDRFWYALFINNGNLPMETTFGIWRVPTFISPFQSKPQETNTEKVTENNSDTEQLPNK